jgi:hypothetical protein
MGETRNTYTVLVGKPLGKGPLQKLIRYNEFEEHNTIHSHTL